MDMTRPKTSSLLCAGLLAGILSVTGCRDESIRAYQVPKEKPRSGGSQMSGSPMTDSSTSVHLHWETVPDDWTEQAPTSMRAASFQIAGKDGEVADFAAIPIPNLSGKELTLVNMWREGMGLGPIVEDQIAEVRSPIVVSGIEGQMFDMITPEPPAGHTANQRTVVAMANRGATTWFFKLTGPDALVQAHKPRFAAFLEAIEFHEGSHDADGAAPAGTLPTPHGDPGLPRWTVPEGWQQTQPGRMLLASFDLSGGSGKVTVSSLGGDAGGLLANINRWRAHQMGLPPATADELKSMVTTAQSTAGEASIVDFANDTERMVVVIVPHAGSTWFYKAMGDPAVIGREKDAFVKFALSAQY